MLLSFDSAVSPPGIYAIEQLDMDENVCVCVSVCVCMLVIVSVDFFLTRLEIAQEAISRGLICCIRIFDKK